MTATTHRTAEEIGRTELGPRALPPLGATREVPLPDVTDVTLPSGLRVLAAHRPGVPMAELRLRVPFAPDAADPATVEHHLAAAELLSATLLTGTATRDRVAIDDELAGVGADVGVSVDPERLQLGGSGLASGLPTILEVVADVLTGATHPDAEVLRERTRLIERITVARAQPRTIAREALQRKRFGEHPLAHEVPTGPDVAAVEPVDVRTLHRTGLVPERAILTLVGDIDAESGVALVDRHLAGWSATHAARELSPPPVPAPSNLELVQRTGSVQSQLRLSAPGLRRLDDRYAALQLANLVFGGYFSSRWMENIREDKGYTYGAHSGTEFVPGGAVLSLETDVATEVTAAALLETRYELGRMAVVPPTPDEVDAARRYAVGSLLISLDSQGGYASTLSMLAADGVPVQWLRDHPGRLEAVTADDVAAAAQQFFAPSVFTGVIVGDADVIGPGLRALGQVDLP